MFSDPLHEILEKEKKIREKIKNVFYARLFSTHRRPFSDLYIYKLQSPSSSLTPDRNTLQHFYTVILAYIYKRPSLCDIRTALESTNRFLYTNILSRFALSPVYIRVVRASLDKRRTLFLFIDCSRAIYTRDDSCKPTTCIYCEKIIFYTRHIIHYFYVYRVSTVYIHTYNNITYIYIKYDKDQMYISTDISYNILYVELRFRRLDFIFNFNGKFIFYFIILLVVFCTHSLEKRIIFTPIKSIHYRTKRSQEFNITYMSTKTLIYNSQIPFLY